MTINPHPFVLAVVVEQRHAEFLALADRERQAKPAAGETRPHQPWAGLPTVRAGAAVLALLLTVSHRG